MVKGSLEKWKTGCGVGAAFQAKEILAWSRTAEVWDYMEYGTKPADRAAEGGYGQNILGKELRPSWEGTLLLDGEFGIYPDLVFFT